MKTGKEPKPAGNIHRQQVFYWMGSSIDARNRGRKVLRDELVKEVLEQVRGSLERGIWVKSPRVPEAIDFENSRLEFKLPIACFTEWSLGQSLSHTAEYGRIGLGFPKRWILVRGGQSVTYFRHDQKGGFLRSLQRLLAQSGRLGGDGLWTPGADIDAYQALLYVLHFAKMIRLKARKPTRKVMKEVAPAVPAKVASKAAKESFTFRRRFGHPLEFAEEREWRIVYHPANKHFVKGPGVPDYYLPYIPGDELFTLVLPDNKVVSHVLQSDWFTERLFTPWKNKLYPALKGRHVPPVTLLAHSDIGTF